MSTPTTCGSGPGRAGMVPRRSRSCARSGSPTQSGSASTGSEDGLSCHWTPAIRAFAAANNIELVPTPTYASYLNRIESTFGALDEFVCKNADYLDWDAFGYALADHVRHRNHPLERERRKTEASKRRQRRAAKTPTTDKLAA
jgi:hypothetical protein